MVKYIKITHPNGTQLIPLNSINNFQYDNDTTLIVMNSGETVTVNEDIIKMLLFDIERDSNKPVVVTSGECL